MRSTITVIVLCLISTFALCQVQEENDIVAEFIDKVRRNDIQGLAGHTIYPLRREYPIPDIKDSAEFVRRYKEVFDDSLTECIVSSDPNNWGAVGWRGITGCDGVWIDDYPGGLAIKAINYQSAGEYARQIELIEAERKTLHESVKMYKKPLCILTTKTFRVRVDEMHDGSLRYASWRADEKMSDKPQLIIQRGDCIREFGDYLYRFVNNEYVYDCTIFLGEDGDSSGMLTITRKDKELLSQEAQLKGR